MISSLKPYLVIGFFLPLLSGCGDNQQTAQDVIRPVKVFHIRGAEEILERKFPGKVDASKKADLAFLVSGKIIEFPIKEGDKVEAGQLIARIDPRDYEIAVEEARSKAELAKAQFERKSKLLEKNFVSRTEYDASKTALEVSTANLDTALQNLGYTRLLAPFSGEIASRYVENFQTVQINEKIVRLQNLDSLEIDVQIPERYAIQSQSWSNTVIEIEFDSAPGNRYPAQIKEISTIADPNTQTYKLTLIMSLPKDLTVLPGMTTMVLVKVNLPKERKILNYQIPFDAVFADEKNNSYVWVINPTTHKIRKQLVKTGSLENNSIDVTEGLEPGMDIVAAGVNFLRDDMQVRPYQDKKEE